MGSVNVTVENIEEILKDDKSVKVAGCDIDGVLRGKLMAKKKFLGIVKEGFGCVLSPLISLVLRARD